MRKLIRCLGLCALLAALVATAQASVVWFDTDLSLGSPLREVDDAYALLLAVRLPELRIAGMSTTYGNAPVHSVTERTRKSLGAFGFDVMVNPGAASARDLGRATAASDCARGGFASAKIYLALGPLTNVATFLQLHPEAAKRI
ncbi:MAG TPA: nucleoside hydrolase [Chthoniobacterales bacterium]|nr:nucleoside hydrolase [Chthoniobacterales bacterium]